MKDRRAAARVVAKTLGLDEAKIRARLEAHEGFTYVARWVDPAKAEALRALDIEAIGIDPEPRRSYPAGKPAAPARMGFRVASLDDTLALLRSRGVPIVREAQDSRWGRRAIVEDPDGNRIDLAGNGHAS